MEYGSFGTNEINHTESVHSVRNINRDTGKQKKKNYQDKKRKKTIKGDILDLHGKKRKMNQTIINTDKKNDEELIMKGHNIDVIIE